MRSAPVAASSATRSSVTPPDTSTRARPAIRSTAVRTSASERLSSRMVSAPAAIASSTSPRLWASTSTGNPRPAVRPRRTASVSDPASRMWLSLIRMPSSSAARWLAPPPARTAYFSSTRSVGVVLRVSKMAARPAAASTKRRVRVAVPDMRCRKLRAVRSALSSAAALPVMRKISSPAAQRSPSRRRRSTSAPGSSCTKASTATSTPASTQAPFATRSPVARCAAGIVAPVVTSSRQASSASARRTISR